jgi:hypothetical protein
MNPKQALKRQKHWLRYSKEGQILHAKMNKTGARNPRDFKRMERDSILLKWLLMSIYGPDGQGFSPREVINMLYMAEQFGRGRGLLDMYRRDKKLPQRRELYRRVKNEDTPRGRALRMREEIDWPLPSKQMSRIPGVPPKIYDLQKKIDQIFLDPMNTALEAEIKAGYRDLESFLKSALA